MDERFLTKRIRVFCDLYIETDDRVQSVIDAGFKVKNPRNKAWELLRRPDVMDYISNARRRFYIENRPTVERIRKELAAIAFFDPKTLFDEKGEMLRLEDIPEYARRCISSIEIYGDKKKVKVHSKVTALEMLAKHLGMFVERYEDITDMPKSTRKERLKVLEELQELVKN